MCLEYAICDSTQLLLRAISGTIKQRIHIDGILPKGPYQPCLRMADRALLAGYPRFEICETPHHVWCMWAIPYAAVPSIIVQVWLVSPRKGRNMDRNIEIYQRKTHDNRCVYYEFFYIELHYRDIFICVNWTHTYINTHDHVTLHES